MAGSHIATHKSTQGPVPFKDVDDDTVPERLPLEYRDFVSTLPSKQQPAGDLQLRCYKGAWLVEYWVPGIIALQHRFKPRPDDIFLASAPKCGTTWLKALAFAIMTRSAYPLEEHPLLRLNPHACIPFLDEIAAAGQEARLDALPSPRLMNTHMPYSVLPTSITDNSHCRVVYICREPKDMVVSLWHFLKRGQPKLSFSEVFESVCDGVMGCGPIWEHVLGYWHASKERPDTVLFLKYEDMLQNPGENVKKMAQFLGRPFSDAEEEAGTVAKVVELCNFDTLRGLKVNKTGSEGAYRGFPRDAFFRKGVAGDWVNHMTPEVARRLDDIVSDKFHGSGLTIP